MKILLICLLLNLSSCFNNPTSAQVGCKQKYLVLSVGGCDRFGQCGVEVEGFPAQYSHLKEIKVLKYPAKNQVVCESQFIINY